MSERKRSEEKSEQGSNESKREFLERSGVDNWMRDALSKVLSNRPDDAIAFLAQYFGSLGEKSNRLSRAHQCLMLTDHHQPTFANNVAEAYEILSAPSSTRTLAGLTGRTYKDVLDLICRDIAAPFREKLLSKIGPREQEVINPRVFHAGIVASFVLIEYLKEAEELFLLLAPQPDKDQVDHELASTMLQELQGALAVQTSDPVSILKAGSQLANEEINDRLLEIMMTSQSGRRQVMTKEEFLVTAFNAYLNEVQAVK